jgi:hypothetical protein
LAQSKNGEPTTWSGIFFELARWSNSSFGLETAINVDCEESRSTAALESWLCDASFLLVFSYVAISAGFWTTHWLECLCGDAEEVDLERIER